MLNGLKANQNNADFHCGYSVAALTYISMNYPRNTYSPKDIQVVFDHILNLELDV